jgi:hypothetical protein
MSTNDRTHPQAPNTAPNPMQAAGRSRWRARATKANVAAGLVVLFVLSGTAAAGTLYVISSNSQVGPATIAGHHNPAGDQANIIAGSINGTDIQTASIGAAQLAAPEPWHAVAPNPDAGHNPCSVTLASPATSEFCGLGLINATQAGFWQNSGGSFTPAGYYRDSQNRVYLRGLVSWNPGVFVPEYVPVFVLPPGYRPSHELVLTTLDNDTRGSYLVRLDILPDGRIMAVNDDEPQSANSEGCTFLSLDGISFRAGE